MRLDFVLLHPGYACLAGNLATLTTVIGDRSGEMAISELTADEAKAIMSGGLGDYELERVTGYCAPLYWAVRDSPCSVTSHNGTAFFLNAGEGLFAVTACHVIDGWMASRASEDAGPLRLGGDGRSVTVDLDRDGIAMDREIDIATFRVSERDVKALGKEVLTGNQKAWPPAPPEERRGIYYAGYPGIGTLHPSPRYAVFGIVRGSGIAHSVSERDVCTQLEREYLMPAKVGEGVPPENFDFRSMSGGLMLTVIQNGLRSWSLAGVIYQGPNIGDEDQAIAGLEVIRARRAHFILPDGRLDVARWKSLTP